MPGVVASPTPMIGMVGDSTSDTSSHGRFVRSASAVR
jgi:hypothetical protein